MVGMGCDEQNAESAEPSGDTPRLGGYQGDDGLWERDERQPDWWEERAREEWEAQQREVWEEEGLDDRQREEREEMLGERWHDEQRDAYP
jgi:hypothetical protein